MCAHTHKHARMRTHAPYDITFTLFVTWHAHTHVFHRCSKITNHLTSAITYSYDNFTTWQHYKLLWQLCVVTTYCACCIMFILTVTKPVDTVLKPNLLICFPWNCKNSIIITYSKIMITIHVHLLFHPRLQNYRQLWNWYYQFSFTKVLIFCPG